MVIGQGHRGRGILWRPPVQLVTDATDHNKFREYMVKTNFLEKKYESYQVLTHRCQKLWHIFCASVWHGPKLYVVSGSHPNQRNISPRFRPKTTQIAVLTASRSSLVCTRNMSIVQSVSSSIRSTFHLT